MEKIPDLEKKRRQPSSTVETQNAPTPRLKTFRLPKFYALRRLCDYDPVTPAINDSISALLSERDALLSAAKKTQSFLNDLSKSNPGFLGKLVLQDYAQWNEAMIELPAVIAKAEARSVPSAPENHLAAPSKP